MIFEYKEPDIDLLIKCLIENGCTVRKAKDGEGGVYLKGKKLTDPLNRETYIITYLIHGYGLEKDWCVFGIKPLSKEEGE